MRHLQFASLFAALAIAPAIFADSNTNTPATNAPFSVTITVDAAKPLGELTPIWRFFGADEPNYAYMKDGKKLIGELGQLGRRVVGELPADRRFISARITCSRAATARIR